MAANSAIDVTELNFDQIKSSLKTFVSAKSEFSDYNFEGSTMSMLLDLLAYNTYQNAYYTSLVGNEMFLDAAQIRNNVVARAKALSYVPVSARGASTTMNVSVTPTATPDSVTVTKNTEFTALVDGQTLKFLVDKDYVLTSEDSYSGIITVKEGVPITHRWTVDVNNPVRYILPNENVDTTTLVVQVKESAASSNIETYILADDITEVSGTSESYFIEETDDGEFEVYFGDGNIGKQPVNNNIVTISYNICNATLGNDISTLSNPSSLAGETSFTATAVSATSGGTDIESINSIKFNAPKNFETQNRAVLADDYKRIILRDNSDFNSVSVWGGEENDPAIYGKVYIAIKPTVGNVISGDRKTSIKNQLKKYNVMGIDPEFVDASFLYINPTISVYYNPARTSLSASAVQTKVTTAVTNFETNNLGTFTQKKFRYSQLMDAVDNADDSIESNLISVKMERRFIPSITTSSDYNISFNNAIFNPHHGHKYAISSSAFTYNLQTAYLDDDGNGVIKIYYLVNNVRTYLNSAAGTVNYSSGLVSLNSFNPTAFSGSELSIYAEPNSNDIQAVRNQILLLANTKVTVYDDTTTLLAATTVTATTSGVTTTVSGTGQNTTVY